MARDLGINAGVVRRWVEQIRSGRWRGDAGKPLKSEAVVELERVRRELERVKMERDILKKALGYFAKDPK